MEKNKLVEKYLDNDMVQIFYNDILVFEYDDSANTNYPEDLTWSRMISGIFYEGIRLGQMIEKKDLLKEDKSFDRSKSRY